MSIRLGEAHYRFTIDDEGLAAGLKRARVRVKTEAAAMAADIRKLSSSFDAVGQKADLAARRAEAAMKKVRAAQRERGAGTGGGAPAGGESEGGGRIGSAAQVFGAVGKAFGVLPVVWAAWRKPCPPY
ncbi:hypothetical protein ABI_21890 [Asticcacaulis biprosthecium C19]|uniref:Uncharacterized protein n=1 Tax=Asticcacaulis biprosthecium C19 TaxID=715226 RepID=F4QGZ4_9CAUL|nr:hypothetical protein [Asticcacaulis biprosthecium]EGF93747.1 hypothetical protein ABI_21890 [Asticcacaulis biprosthecium C19]